MSDKHALSAMQTAVDIVNDSPHPVNKVAACLFLGSDHICSTNFWPARLEETLGREARIGNSSGTIHAETACIFRAPFATEGASITITDPFCPNCAKNIAEAGIKHAYIDHKGFEKDFWSRRSGHFQNMSMEIMAKAGISVYEVNRRAEQVTPIYEPDPGYIPAEDSPVEIEPAKPEADFFELVVLHKGKLHYNRKIAVAFVTDSTGHVHSLTARAHAVIGYSMRNDADIDQMMQAKGKYSFIQEPLNRLLMYARRKDYQIMPDFIFSSQVPTAREQVNLVGAGFSKLMIGDHFKSRDPSGLKARTLMQNHGLIEFADTKLLFKRDR